jgi:O-6-methylguanine DNA methyltransferase
MIGIYTKDIEAVWFGVACDDEKIYATNFGSGEKGVLQDLLDSIPFNAPFQQSKTISAFAGRVIRTLKDVYYGRGTSDNLPLAMDHLSDHTKNVLRVATLIPVGYVASYGSVAEAMGGSPRGVGRVMALNPFAPIVPCHRVVGSDFSLVGYGGGLEAKLAFLKRERKGFTSKKEIPVDGRKLLVFPVELVLKKVEKR